MLAVTDGGIPTGARRISLWFFLFPKEKELNRRQAPIPPKIGQ
jgi:hypothetical protein